MNKLPPRVKKPLKSTYDQLVEMVTEKNKEKWIEIGRGIEATNARNEQLRFWLHVKKFSVPYIADISGRTEEEILEDIKKWNLELPAHE
jgi:hypothetical protein